MITGPPSKARGGQGRPQGCLMNQGTDSVEPSPYPSPDQGSSTLCPAKPPTPWVLVLPALPSVSGVGAATQRPGPQGEADTA